ncbi:uncharacterized protein LOC130979082 [Arachis stenosperma]|uniref:uncharacterized protein LOC130979082 n=1 Tax=Arachis stenosperma TaxID=217475 RepID=UPI0025ACB5BF|nr:uncharacterized protein LOC130979082 [Arachis stenosperma]
MIVDKFRHVRQSGLFGYEIQEKESFVIRLLFHLENKQPVVYSKTSNVNDIVERAISQVHIFGMDDSEHVIFLCSKDFFFVYGHGDTGKIFLWNLMSAEIRSRGDVVLNIASSGITSLLLSNGRTIHSRFKIPLNITENSICNIKPGSSQVMLLLKVKLIIWDETPKVLKLTKNMRLFVGMTTSDQDETEQFSEWLLKVCESLICDNMDGESEICLPGDIVIPSSDQESQLDLYGPELLNSINYSGLSQHKLIVKIGVPVMLMRNIEKSSSLCNGTGLQVRKLGNHVIKCEVLTGNNIGHIALIPRMNMVPTNETVPIRFQRRQFPIIVSFAMTINKPQE